MGDRLKEARELKKLELKKDFELKRRRMDEAEGRTIANLQQAEPARATSMIQATTIASSGVATLGHDHEHEEHPYPVQAGLLSDKAADQYIDGAKGRAQEQE